MTTDYLRLRARARLIRDRAQRAQLGSTIAAWSDLASDTADLEAQIGASAQAAGRGPAGRALSLAASAALLAHAMLIDGQQGSALEQDEQLLFVRARLTEAASLLFVASQGGTVETAI